MSHFSQANFDILADFYEFEALHPNEASEQDEDLAIFLDVLYEESNDEGRQLYDAEMATRDPTKYPRSALHAPEGFVVPVFFLLLSRREDLERDDELAELPEEWANATEAMQWGLTHSIAKKMAEGWRPDIWTPDYEDPYADPYADDLAPLPTGDELPDKVTETDDIPPADDRFIPMDDEEMDKWLKETKEATDKHNFQVQRERKLIAIGAGIAATTVLGIWSITAILKG